MQEGQCSTIMQGAKEALLPKKFSKISILLGMQDFTVGKGSSVPEFIFVEEKEDLSSTEANFLARLPAYSCLEKSLIRVKSISCENADSPGVRFWVFLRVIMIFSW